MNARLCDERHAAMLAAEAAAASAADLLENDPPNIVRGCE